jgi:hypothetical protein
VRSLEGYLDLVPHGFSATEHHFHDKLAWLPQPMLIMSLHA